MKKYLTIQAIALKTQYLFDRKLSLSLVGGLLFLLIFNWGYTYILNEYYQIRDDGLITLSHARNLIDYGFIGVGPSGERVEGYSAPVQFFLYAFLYKFFKIDYKIFFEIQTPLSTFLLGLLFVKFFEEKKIFAIVLSAVSCVVLTKLMSFMQWHGSGMENAISHVLFLFTIYILYSFAKKEKINYIFSFFIFLATISRLENIYHVTPLLIIFTIYWLMNQKNFQGLYFSFLVFFIFISYHTWRYYYFGDFHPNTAYAQGISISSNIKSLIDFDISYINKSYWLAKKIFSYHGVSLLILSIPLIFLAKKDKYFVLLISLFSSIIFTALFNPFLFGATRLDPTRSTTHLAVIVVLTISITCFYFPWKSKKSWVISPILLFLLFLILKQIRIEPYDACCKIDYFDLLRKEFVTISDNEALPRPTIANPDLGLISWHKQFNIVDLGMLGSPIMAKLKNGRILADYFFDFAAPDIIESHDYWSCRYLNSIFKDNRFREKYFAIHETKDISRL